ncbi:TOMM precursor leader peptide-binding protein [Nocardia sp. NPDC049190]|uniref:TOMM precursor leader peptide-binding protein n=1 Tax=Nocardia sp. NPDC049190 TaxID=3155650 RepID=UPI0033F5C896
MTTMCRGPRLRSRVTVLVRPTGVVQLGCDPETALVLDPEGMDAETVLGFLRLLDGLRTQPQILWRAGEHGIAPDSAVALLTLIDEAGLLDHPEDRAGQVRAVRVHGLGPLSDAVSAGLRTLGVRPTRSHDYAPHASTVRTWQADLVVLADALMPDPQLVNDLVLHRIPHLQLRIRDNKGVIGPLVLPGATSCLRCADLIRAQNDAAWPHLAAQLLGRAGSASPAGIAATTAIALGELEAIMECSPGRAPATLNATVELDLDSHVLDRRAWAPHPACPCTRISPGLTAETTP